MKESIHKKTTGPNPIPILILFLLIFSLIFWVGRLWERRNQSKEVTVTDVSGVFVETLINKMNDIKNVQTKMADLEKRVDEMEKNLLSIRTVKSMRLPGVK